MKHLLAIPAVLILVTLNLWAAETATLPEAGPENGGLRLRLTVIPRAPGEKAGYEVRVDLLNTTTRAITLRAGWGNDNGGNLKDYIEAATSIECVPAVLPWSGGVRGPHRKLPQPEHLLHAGEVLSVTWRTEGWHLKNRVTNPNEVQNPEFPFPGMYSVHASLDAITSEGLVALRSNEQLVRVGGSHSMPKYTYGHLLEVGADGKTATLGIGSRHKVALGDQFEHLSKHTPWKLTITRVSPAYSWGRLEMLSEKPRGTPRRGAGASLIRKK